MVPQELDFPGARSIAVVTRSVTNKKTGKTTTEVVPYISSLVDPSPQTLLSIIRQHWTIECSIFCRRDVFYNEDRSTLRTKHAPYNLALFRSFTISLAKLAGFNSLPLAVHKFKKCSPSMLNYFKLPAGLYAI